MKIGRFRFPARPEPPPGPRESWSLEVQIHPSDIRKRVRYIFLTRTQVTLWSLVVLVYLLFLSLAAAVAPGVISGMLNRQEYFSLVAQRSRQGDRLRGLVGRLEQLAKRAERLHLSMEKVFLAYSLPLTRSRGTGGYPLSPAASPRSIYAGAIERGNRLEAQVGEQLGVLDSFLREVTAFERTHPEQVAATPSISPLRRDFVLTSSFGRRRSPFTHEPEFHAGLDLAARPGTPVHAPSDGVVAFAGTYSLVRSAGWWRYGNLVIIENGDRFVTLFGHCDEVRVRAGQRVRRGEVLATVGNTGWSTSPHLHYEVRRKGADGVYRPVDPSIYVLDQRWPNEERLLARAKGGDTGPKDFEPLPPQIGR